MANNGRGRQVGNGNGKEITRNLFDEVTERGTPETGHTDLLPEDELVVSVPMDNGWTRALEVGHLPEMSKQTVLVDMDPIVDPVLFWSGKRNRRNVPVLPLQRNEIVTESRIAQIVDRVRAQTTVGAYQPSLFAEMEKAIREGDKERRADWFTHEEGWKNKLICGDSLQVMESLIEYEGLRGKVQMIYVDPPYGIKYDSNFQQRIDSTRNNDKDLADDALTIKAFRDTWALGIHSYLSYLQERLYLCRELLTDSGSIFIQISDDNVHRVRLLLDEVFGASNFVSQIVFRKTTGKASALLDNTYDTLLWYAKNVGAMKYRQVYKKRSVAEDQNLRNVQLQDGTRRQLSSDELANTDTLPTGARIFRPNPLTSQSASTTTLFAYEFQGKTFRPSKGGWKTNLAGMQKLDRANRLMAIGNTLCFIRYLDDFPFQPINNVWDDTRQSGFGDPKVYVVQTAPRVLEYCLWMTTDPGDAVFDPTCGSGTTAYMAEKWGRRWITCDTSRVAINVARQRLLGGVYDQFVTRSGALSSGVVYRSAAHVTLRSLTNDLEPEKVELVDQPEIDRDVFRVTGPFEVMTLGRYSPDDWKGYVNESGTLENYIAVICRLYHKDAAIQSGVGFVHAITDFDHDRIAISVGPLTGRVTPKQIKDAVDDATGLGISEVHILGWAFEANVGEIVSQLEERGNTRLRLIMIRPDSLAEGLKITQPETLFSPLSLPDVDLQSFTNHEGERQATVTLNGVGLFNRKHRTTEYHHADDGYVAAWYLDEDYDGDCFVDCQMSFDFAKAPNLRAALKADVDPEEYRLQLTSQPFPIRDGKQRVAVKVVDVYGNESTVVRDLA